MEEVIKQLVEALEAAESHLDYCGYGDKWESECALDGADPLGKKIAAALKAGHAALASDTLEVGDEISWTIIAEFTAKVIAIAAGHVMYQWHDGQVNMEPLSYFQHHSFKITKKAGAQ